MYKKILLCLVLIAGAVYQTAAQAPVNDDCTGATAIVPAPFETTCSAPISASTENATASAPGTSCNGSPDDDIWYSFTATSSSIIFRYANARNVATGNQTSPSFALYEGSCPSTTTALVCIAVNVSGGGYRIIDGLAIGTAYYFRLWSLSDGIVMNIDFCIQAVPAAPSNDECVVSAPIATLPPGSTCTAPIGATTVGATPSPLGSSCGSGHDNDDIWYSFTANTTAVSIQFSNARLATSNGNALLGYALYKDNCPVTTSTIACSSNTGSGSGSVILPGLAPGDTYYVRFFSFGGNNYMTFDFCITDVILAQNDECSGALPIATYAFGDTCIPARISTANATQSSPNPNCTSSENNDDVWYRFTATTASMVLRVTNVVNNETGGGGTAGFALYQDACPSTTATIACNNIVSAGSGYQIINGLLPGREYYLRLWSTLTGGNSVSFDLCLQMVEAAANDECTNAIAIPTEPLDSLCNNTIHASTSGATRSAPDHSCADGYNDDDIWYSFTAVRHAVRINFSNAFNSAGSGGSGLGYALYAGPCPVTTPIGCHPLVGTRSGDVLVGGLTPGQTYYIRFFSYAENNYLDFDFCVVDVDLPPNDECANAIEIMPGNGFCTTPVIGRIANATTSAGFTVPSCEPGARSEDIWFKTTVPASGNLVIQTSTVNNSSVEDVVMEAYTGACGSLTMIACDDNGNPEPHPAGMHARISLTGRTPGELIYLRVVKKFDLFYDQFAICAWDSTVVLPVAAGGNCVDGAPVQINAANGNQFMWVPLFDQAGNIIAEINARGNELGAISSKLFVNTTGMVRNLNGHYYLDRNLSIEPENSGTVRLRFYLKNEELQSLMAVDGTVAGADHLKIIKTNASCGPSLTGQVMTILPDTSGSYGADFFVEFPITSFSSFFIDGGTSALPLEFLSFKAEKMNGQIQLEWIVVQDDAIDKFEVQRSNDGNSFIHIGEQSQNGFISASNNSWKYHFSEPSPVTGTVFYRIKMIDINGKQVYSKVVALTAGASYAGPGNIYPNPVAKYLVIRLPGSVTSASLTLFNSTGAEVKRLPHQPISNGVYTLDMQAEAAGIYFLQVTDGRNNYQFKVIKQ